jgi:outer membrane protein assembly factor BamB
VTAAWPQYRHDASHTGQAIGAVASNPGSFKWPTPGILIDGSPISASPAIGVGNTIYVGTEGGTLAAVNSGGTIKWTATNCSACAGPTPPTTPTPSLGPLISSPAVYNNPHNGNISIFVGSTTGNVYVFTDNGSSASCAACFQAGSGVSFVSSPIFTFNSSTLVVNGIFIGATVAGDAGTQEGRMYAVNADGSQQWVYPGNSSAPTPGPITSSPALGLGGSALYFPTDDGTLFALTLAGSFLWQFPADSNVECPPVAAGQEALSDADAPLAPSAITTSDSIYFSTLSGKVIALNRDGSFRWCLTDDSFTSSLAIGVQAVVTFTPTSPPALPTPTPQPGVTASPTPSATPLSLESTIFGITTAGNIVVVAATGGEPLSPTGPLPTPVSGSVLSSPALSSDDFLIFATDSGMLYAVSTATGLPPGSGWPVAVTAGAAIQSSPAIASDGTIYVGADDGKLYAVGSP